MARKPDTLTKAQTRAAIQGLGLTARWSAEWSEWRITVPPGSMHYVKALDDAAREDMAHYCGDNEDALDTARAMRDELTRRPPPGFKAPWARPGVGS